ncbi:glutathione S-transferase family protein [Sphingomonas sp.]|uniref:glutathione S-transferase family protein n=1 Tax=Sphingomonas sp. TaxID=28214 RepID=UPI003CC617CB
MIVYGSTISPFVRKVVAFAAEKGIAVTVTPGGMGRGGPDFLEASPFRKMPALRDPGADDGRDFILSDSTAIVAYLEAKQPDPNLIPTAAAARARTIWFEQFASTIVTAAGSKMFFNRMVAPRFLKQPGDAAAADAAERDEMPPILDYLERIAPAPGGFLIDERVTLADLAVASPFANLALIGFDLSRWPRVQAWVDSVLARPSFACVASDRAMIAALP